MRENKGFFSFVFDLAHVKYGVWPGPKNASVEKGRLDPGQTPYFTWAESNANEGEQRVFLICIRFGSWEVRRLTKALSNDDDDDAKGNT